MAKARTYKESDLKRLFALSGCECANPNCSYKLLSTDYNTIFGEICHIEAAETNGPRFNPAQTDDERRSFDNLILLCERCHKEVDNNPSKYTVELLKKWKKEHQEKVFNSIAGKMPNSFQKIVLAIASKGIMDNEPDSAPPLPYEIAEKIEYNNLRNNRFIVEEYNIYTSSLHSIYDELEALGSIKKSVVIKTIRNSYLKAKGTYTDGSIGDIRNNSDEIFDCVVDAITELAKDTKIEESELYLVVQMIVVDAFIECNVLEKPKR